MISALPEYDSFYIYLPMQVAQVYFRLFEDASSEGAAMPSVMATEEEIDASSERV